MKTPSLVLFVGVCLALGCGGESESDTDPTNADDDDDDSGDDDNDDNNDDNDDSVSDSGTDSSSGASVDTGDTGLTSDTGATGDTGDTTGVDESTGDPTGDTEGSTGEQPGDTIYDVQNGTIAVDTPVEIFDVIVTAVANNGLFVQEPAGGEYSGVFVFSNSDDGGPDISGAAIGDTIEFSGVTAEFFDHTQIDITAGTYVNNGADGELAPELVDIATFGDEVTAEPWESVLVRVEGDLTVTALLMFDEFSVSDSGDELIIDNFVYNAPTSDDFPNLGVGASFTAIQGPLNFSFMNFKIAPRSATDLEGYAEP